MGRVLLLLAALASLALLFAGGALEPPLRGSSRLAWVALPWLAFSGLPPGSSERAPLRRWPFALALALPALALGAWLDLHAGFAPGATALTGGAALAWMVLLGEAGHRATARPLLHALGWVLLVPAGPLLAASLGSGLVATSWLTRLSPLSWIWTRIPAGAEESGAPLAALLAAGLLLLSTLIPPTSARAAATRGSAA